MIPSLLLALSLLTAPQLEVRDVVRDVVAAAHEGVFDDLRDAGNADHLRKLITDALRVRCIRVEGVVFERLDVDGTNAVAEVEIATRKSDRETPTAWMPIETMPLRLRLARQHEQWRVTFVEYPDEELAKSLIEAGSPDEELRLLQANERRVTKNLVRVVERSALNWANSRTWEKAVPIAGLVRRLAMLAGDRGGESLASNVDSVLARLSRDRERALRLSGESLAIANETNDPEVLSRAWRLHARTLEEFDTRGPEQEVALRRALDYALHVEDPLLTARAYHALVNFAYDRRDLFSARSWADQSVPFVRASGDPGAKLTYDIFLQMIYCDQGDREQCRYRLDRNIEQMQDGQWQLPYALHDLAALDIEDGRLDEARTLLARALRENSARTPEIVPDVLQQLAVIEAREGRLEEAECMLRRAGDLDRQIGTLSGPLFDLIAPLVLKRDPVKALRLSLEEASVTQGLLPENTMRSLVTAARGYRALGMRERALATAREAIAFSETSADLIAGGNLQQVRSAESVASCYELAADLARAGGDVKEALTLVERGRGQVLYDMIERGGRDLDSELEAGERVKQEKRLSQLNVELSREGGPAAEQKLLAARREYESFVDGLRARRERRTVWSRPLETESLDHVVRALPPGLAVIEYVVGDDEVQAFVVRGARSITTHTIHIDRTSLAGRVEKLAAMLAARNLRYDAAARELYALLIHPLEGDLAGANALCIIPDESLWRVPFAALRDARGRFLIERAALVYAPSIRVYVAMAGRTEHRASPRVFALANPTLDFDAQKDFTSFYRDKTLGALPDAEKEVDGIRDLYGSSRCVILKRASATEARSKKEMQDASILHFATHGLLDDRNPMYSRLMLARDARDGDDGSLEAWEIARLSLDADLVVLSACDTARGTIGGGEGVIGMAWAFFAAGARSTVATEWKIGSRSASQVMVAFHASLRSREGEPLAKARALRDAQLQLIGSAANRHPFHWAAFVLLGDGS